jgi:hypothetical protein
VGAIRSRARDCSPRALLDAAAKPLRACSLSADQPRDVAPLGAVAQRDGLGLPQRGVIRDGLLEHPAPGTDVDDAVEIPEAHVVGMHADHDRALGVSKASLAVRVARPQATAGPLVLERRIPREGLRVHAERPARHLDPVGRQAAPRRLVAEVRDPRAPGRRVAEQRAERAREGLGIEQRPEPPERLIPPHEVGVRGSEHVRRRPPPRRRSAAPAGRGASRGDGRRRRSRSGRDRDGR